MSREILVVTPENIEIEYELAGIGSRFLANLLDTFLQLAHLCADLDRRRPRCSDPRPRRLRVRLARWGQFFAGTGLGVRADCRVSGSVGLFIWFETVWNGQTPGKRQIGLRVIRDGGYPINIYAAIVRNLIRVMDGMPIIAVGLILVGLFGKQPLAGAMGGLCILIPLMCMLLSTRYQRLGDFVAGTMVVKQRAPRVPTLEALAPPPRVLPGTSGSLRPGRHRAARLRNDRSRIPRRPPLHRPPLAASPTGPADSGHASCRSSHAAPGHRPPGGRHFRQLRRLPGVSCRCL